MIIEKTGDIFQTDAKIIAQFVNCQRKCTTKISEHVKNKYPHVFTKYVDLIAESKKLQVSPLGVAQLVPLEYKYRYIKIGDKHYYGRYLANLFVRNNANDEVSFDALIKALKSLEYRRNKKDGLFQAVIAIQDSGDITKQMRDKIETYLQNYDVEIWTKG